MYDIKICSRDEEKHRSRLFFGRNLKFIGPRTDENLFVQDWFKHSRGWPCEALLLFSLILLQNFNLKQKLTSDTSVIGPFSAFSTLSSSCGSVSFSRAFFALSSALLASACFVSRVFFSASITL